MKVGDPVLVTTSQGRKCGILISTGKKKFMIGPVVDVLLEGEIQTILQDRVVLIGGKNES